MNTNYKFAIDRISRELKVQAQQQNKYIALYQAIKQCILKVELPNHWKLPSTRILADELQLSRTTVLKAYELLLLEKLIESKPGSGNVVNYSSENLSAKIAEKPKSTNGFSYPDISEQGQSYLKNIGLINRLPNDHLAFRPGLPPIDVFPVNQWKKLLNSYWRHVKASGLSYSQASGLNELKESICNYLNVSRNIKCSPDRLVVVSGSLQSLFLIASTVLNKGDLVVVENPIFPNVHSVFKSSQANLVALPVDNEGIALEQLSKLGRKKPKLIHVTPSNHYPLGIKMSLKRRQELLHWASQHGSLVIENDYEHEIANLHHTVPAIYSLDKEDRIIYMGTFNRLLHPSIRLGYMIVPQYLMPTVEALQEHSHRFVSPSIQVVMNQFIEKNYLYQHIKNCIQVAKERHYLFRTEFSKKVKTMELQEKPFSSFHVIAFFKEATTAKEEIDIVQQLKANGVTAFSLSKCYVQQPSTTGLIFGYAAVRDAILKRKIEKIRQIIG
jgi:GntR family transcriptional regulator / MocR family aminotransferase